MIFIFVTLQLGISFFAPETKAELGTSLPSVVQQRHKSNKYMSEIFSSSYDLGQGSDV